jgi:RNA recognition motif-containing protein
MKKKSIPEEYGSNLFVGDLSSFCDEDQITNIFAEHGFHIIEAKLMRGHRTLSSLNYGFVKLRTNDEAARAISALDGKLIFGRKIRVNWAVPNKPMKQSEKTSNSLYVKFQTLVVSQFCRNFLKFGLDQF